MRENKIAEAKIKDEISSTKAMDQQFEQYREMKADTKNASIESDTEVLKKFIEVGEATIGKQNSRKKVL